MPVTQETPRRDALFTTADGESIVATGKKMAKKRNPVYLIKQESAFRVQTNEGIMSGNAGDFLAHDPISGHVWPVAASYVEVHYEDF